MTLIHAADLLCERHVREAAEREVSGVNLALAVAWMFNHAERFRDDDPGWRAFIERPVCDQLNREEIEWCYSKAIRMMPPKEKEQRRVKVPTTPIDQPE